MRINEKLLDMATKPFVVLYPPLNKEKDTEFTKGIHHLKEEHVIISSFNGSQVFGLVQDEDNTQEVTLHLLNPKENSCSCNLFGSCEHIVAVFAKVYTEKRALKRLLKERLQYTLLETQKIKTASTIIQEKKKVLENNPKVWWEDWKQQFANFKLERKRSFLYSDYLLLNDTVELFYPRIIKNQKENYWYCTYATYFCLNELLLQLENHHVLNPFQEKNIMPLIYKLLDDFLEWHNEAKKSKPPCPYKKTMTKQIISLLLMISKYRFSVFYIFYLWTKEYISQQDKQELLNKYQSIKGESSTIVRGVLSFHLEDDKNLLRELTSVQTEEFIEYVHFFTESILYESVKKARLLMYVDEYKNLLSNMLSQPVPHVNRSNMVQKYLQLYFLIEETETKREKELYYFMPYSFQLVSERLIMQEKYNEFGELLFLLDYDVEDIPIEVEGHMEKNCPETLLPFYYRKIETLISQKNRQSYREAVRNMKQMKKLYRRMKDLDTFEGYIQYIVAKTKRMKAFQEELTKGRLIT